MGVAVSKNDTLNSCARLCICASSFQVRSDYSSSHSDECRPAVWELCLLFVIGADLLLPSACRISDSNPVEFYMNVIGGAPATSMKS